MRGGDNERGDLRLTVPLWVVGSTVLLLRLLGRRPLVALAGAAMLAYDGRALLDRGLGTVGALTRPTHDEASA